MTKPQHDQYYEAVASMLDTHIPDSGDHSFALSHLMSLRDGAAKVPGLESLLADAETREEGQKLRAEQAESERDAAQRFSATLQGVIDAALAACDGRPVAEFARGVSLVEECIALRERVATLEREQSDINGEALRINQMHDAEKARADKAEARVKELHGDFIMSGPDAQPPPAPAQGPQTAAPSLVEMQKRAESFAKYHAEHAAYRGASQEFHERATSFLRTVVPDVEALVKRETTPTQPALVEAVGRVLDCPYHIDSATVPAAGVDSAPAQVVGVLSVGLLKYRALRAAYDAARTAPVPVGLMEAVGVIVDEATEPDRDARYVMVPVGEWDALRSAYDAAKGGQALVHCPGCKQMAPAEQMHTRCTMCAAYEDERLRQGTLEDSVDAEDAAKYRAAVERAKDKNAMYRAACASFIGSEYGDDVETDIRDRSVGDEMMSIGPDLARYFGLTLDAPPSGPGGES